MATITLTTAPDTIPRGQPFEVGARVAGYPAGTIVVLKLERTEPREGPWQIAVAILSTGVGSGTFRGVALTALGTAALTCARSPPSGGAADARLIEVTP